MDVKITQIDLVEGRVNRAGSRPIAFFSCDLGGLVRIKGCQLMRTENNGLAIWLPSFTGEKSHAGEAHKSVTIVNDPLRHAVMTAARNAYRALGGRHAEWEPRT